MPTIHATSAKELLIDTIKDRASIFVSGDWISLARFREEIIHPFDKKRLELSYTSAGDAWTAMKTAACSLPWLETRGEGLELEFRCKHLPKSRPINLMDAMDEIEHLRKALATWKDAGNELLDLTAAAHALRLSMEAAEWRLVRSGALAFYYRTMAENLAAVLLEKGVKHVVHPPTPFDLEGITANPASHGQVTNMLDSVGLLTPERLDEFAEE